MTRVYTASGRRLRRTVAAALCLLCIRQAASAQKTEEDWNDDQAYKFVVCELPQKFVENAKPQAEQDIATFTQNGKKFRFFVTKVNSTRYSANIASDSKNISDDVNFPLGANRKMALTLWREGDQANGSVKLLAPGMRSSLVFPVEPGAIHLNWNPDAAPQQQVPAPEGASSKVEGRPVGHVEAQGGTDRHRQGDFDGNAAPSLGMYALWLLLTLASIGATVLLIVQAMRMKTLGTLLQKTEGNLLAKSNAIEAKLTAQEEELTAHREANSKEIQRLAARSSAEEAEAERAARNLLEKCAELSGNLGETLAGLRAVVDGGANADFYGKPGSGGLKAVEISFQAIVERLNETQESADNLVKSSLASLNKAIGTSASQTPAQKDHTLLSIAQATAENTTQLSDIVLQLHDYAASDRPAQEYAEPHLHGDMANLLDRIEAALLGVWGAIEMFNALLRAQPVPAPAPPAEGQDSQGSAHAAGSAEESRAAQETGGSPAQPSDADAEAGIGFDNERDDQEAGANADYRAAIPAGLDYLEKQIKPSDAKLKATLARMRQGFSTLTEDWEEMLQAILSDKRTRQAVSDLDWALYFDPAPAFQGMTGLRRKQADALCAAWKAAQAERLEELRAKHIERIDVVNGETEQIRDEIAAGPTIETTNPNWYGKASHVEPGDGGYKIDGEPIFPTKAVFYIPARASD